jgi:hypothetical protein
MAGVGGLGGLLGPGSVAQQFLLWGVLQQLAGAILQPIVQQILDETWPRLTSARLSPEVAADLVLKGWWDMSRGAAEAAATGIDADRFAQLVNDTGEPIGLQDLLLAYRRGFLSWDEGKGGPPSVMEGIRQSRVRDEWADTINKLRLQPITASDAVAAVVRGQIDHALGEQIAYYNGIAAADFTILVNTYGSPPPPQELMTLVRRGIIPRDGVGPGVLSMQQGIFEGDSKDKWYPAYVALLEYRPPPRTITALERAGVITAAHAQQLYTQAGLSTELAAAYSADASMTKLAKTKQLAEGTILNLYRAQVLTGPEATTLLADLGYDATESAWVLSWEDMHRELAAVNSAITRVANLYITRKIGPAEAGTALDSLGVPPAQKTELLRTWQLERDAVVKVLTAAEVADALFYTVMDQATAQTALESLGYDPYDAWVLLSLRNHAPLPGAPPPSGNVTGQTA